MRTSKKILSLLIACVMVLSLLPAAAFATGEDMVYISVSYDDKYVQVADGSYLAYVGIPLADIAAVDLTEYGLENMLYDRDGDGNYETTVLQLIIYAHENLYGGSWDDVTFDAVPGSSYFAGGLFGFDENLNYFLNGVYPMDEEMSEAWGYGVGATSDRIVLKAGDVIEMGSFKSWDFYADSGYGFHEFADENGEFTHNYTAEEGTALTIRLVRSYSSMGSGAEVYTEPGYTVYYGSAYNNPTGSVVTDIDGMADITFPNAGTYYVWCDGGYGYEFSESIVSTPAFAVVTVKAAAPQDIAVTGITLNKTSAEMIFNEEMTLTATITPENATDKTIRWESSYPEIATVDSNGKVTAVGVGTTTITASAKGNKSATCTVNVAPSFEITIGAETLTNDDVDIISGATYKTYEVTVPADTETVDIQFSNPVDACMYTNIPGQTNSEFWADFEYQSGVEELTAVPVDPNGDGTGDDLSVQNSNYDYTGGDESAGPRRWYTIRFVVEEAPVVSVSGIALDKSAAELTVGDTLTLSATVSPDDATDQTVTWATSDAAVATVDNGTVTAVAAGSATITASAGDKSAACAVTVNAKTVEPPVPDTPQDVSSVLNATMAQMAATVTAPAFGTNAGEWTVLSLARGGYYQKDNAYFTDYYNRIVETVNETATSVDMNGALHKNKSTENSRLIVALSSIGKDATSVGDWDLVEAYSANGLDWIKKQGINGVIWALIALDSNDYATSDSTIRQQCVDYILSQQHDDGGWVLQANLATPSDPDITGMALQALYPYRNQAAVAQACEEAFTCLSQMQAADGHFISGGAPNAESAAQVIVACTTWGINPDTDSRFIKNGVSAVDAVLAHYVESEAEFKHVMGANETNNMATDQSCYALVAYDRLLKGKNALYDCGDVTFDAVTPSTDEMTATLGLPAEINAGDAFNGTISVNKWDNEGKYKLIDFIVNVPEGVSVTGVTVGDRLTGGEVIWNQEEETGKLRVTYFDANENKDLTITGEEFPAGLFTIGFKAENVTSGSKLGITISGMSVKLTSDSSDENAMIVVNTDTANGNVDVVVGISFSAVCLYEGDDVDLIPATKKAVAVAVTGIAKGAKLTFKDGETEIVFKYSKEVTEKSGIATYVAIVDATIDMTKFIDQSKFTIGAVSEDAVTFGDSNGDDVINAQDALAAVDAWLRKGEELTDGEILVLNINGDSRINTFDALGIVEAFVNGTEYGVVTKAATITTKQ